MTASNATSIQLETQAVLAFGQLHQMAYAQVSPDLSILQTSSNFEFVLENGSEPVVGRLLTEVLVEFVGVEDMLYSVLQGRLPTFKIEHVNRNQNETPITYLTFHVLPLDKTQPGNGLLIITENSTHHGQLEQNLLQHRNELRLVQDELMRVNAELDDRVEHRTVELNTAREQLQTQLERLKALRHIDLTILGTADIQLALKAATIEAQKHLKADTVIVMLFNPDLQWLETAACQGMHTSKSLRLRIGEGMMGNTALERRTMRFTNLDKETPSFLSPLETLGKIKSFFSMPLIARGNLLGVFGVGLLSPLKPDQEWMDFFENLSNQLSMGIDTLKSFETLSRANAELSLAYETTIDGWSHAMSLRDKETFDHTDRVTEITLRIARMMGMSDELLTHVRRGAILHDIGKMGIPDGILLKPHELTPEEWDVMRKHPVYAYDMLQPIAYLRPALDIPYCHHEKWNGSGYPRGLKGEQIPLAARIFSVIDVWDALRFDRPYRKRWSDKKTMEYIRSESGKSFDPQIVEIFLQMIGDVK